MPCKLQATSSKYNFIPLQPSFSMWGVLPRPFVDVKTPGIVLVLHNLPWSHVMQFQKLQKLIQR